MEPLGLLGLAFDFKAQRKLNQKRRPNQCLKLLMFEAQLQYHDAEAHFSLFVSWAFGFLRGIEVLKTKP